VLGIEKNVIVHSELERLECRRCSVKCDLQYIRRHGCSVKHECPQVGHVEEDVVQVADFGGHYAASDMTEDRLDVGAQGGFVRGLQLNVSHKCMESGRVWRKDIQGKIAKEKRGRQSLKI
jgi:hypothetical protein